VRDLLAEESLLLATAGAEAGFHVIYCRLASTTLRMTDERVIVTQLLRDHRYALRLLGLV
jgi:hypothetical protein